jgi:hypothetical protein
MSGRQSTILWMWMFPGQWYDCGTTEVALSGAIIGDGCGVDVADTQVSLFLPFLDSIVPFHKLDYVTKYTRLYHWIH